MTASLPGRAPARRARPLPSEARREPGVIHGFLAFPTARSPEVVRHAAARIAGLGPAARHPRREA